MKILFLLFFGIFINTLPSFAQAEVNQNDAQGNRHGLWKKLYKGSKQVRYEGVFEHGKEVGIFKFYCEGCKRQPSVVKEFNVENSIAEVKYYTGKGKLVSEGKMDAKNRIGEWLFYPEKASNVLTREQYKAGKLDGPKVTYYPNGKITEERNYRNGLLEGPNNYYASDGILLKKLQYKNDVLVGPAFYYDAGGIISIEGFYKNGKKHGLWKHYKNGKLEREETHPKPLNNLKN
jgi:antitoxin component YwqK of YwqJK toxin-antitoxin module